jgi:hypothetical protein
MAKPEYKATQSRLERGLSVQESLQISFWFNIDDPHLKAQLDAYYEQHRDDSKKQPGLELQVRVGDNYQRVCRSRLYLNDGKQSQSASAAPPPPAGSVPPPAQAGAAPPPPTDIDDDIPF